MTFDQLEQLVAVAELGTVSAAAERLHISQPALSRSLQRLEQELGGPLFDHGKNRLELNDTGRVAVAQARATLAAQTELCRAVKAQLESLKTIAVGSAGPAPLWTLLPTLGDLYPGMTITSRNDDVRELEQGLADGTFQLVVLPGPSENPDAVSVPYVRERLYFSVPPAHPLALRTKGVHLSDLDGADVLVLPNLGHWQRVHDEGMPRTHFIVSRSQEDYDAVAMSSALPIFTTDLSRRFRGEGAATGRVHVPILDEAAQPLFHVAMLRDSAPRFDALLRELRKGRLLDAEDRALLP